MAGQFDSCFHNYFEFSQTSSVTKIMVNGLQPILARIVCHLFYKRDYRFCKCASLVCVFLNSILYSILLQPLNPERDFAFAMHTLWKGKAKSRRKKRKDLM